MGVCSFDEFTCAFFIALLQTMKRPSLFPHPVGARARRAQRTAASAVTTSALATRPRSECEVSRRVPAESQGYFGPHLMLDGLAADPERLNDMRLVYRFLDELPEKIGMKKITTPYVIPYVGEEKPEDAGITGMVIIAESHISIHTFPQKGFVTIDVYSCRSFNQEDAIAFAKELFGIERCEVQAIERGHGFVKT